MEWGTFDFGAKGEGQEMTTLDQFNAWMTAPEDGHLEFEKAKNRYDFWRKE